MVTRPSQRFAFSRVTNKAALPKKEEKAKAPLSEGETTICEPVKIGAKKGAIVGGKRRTTEAAARQECMRQTMQNVASAWQQKQNEIVNITSEAERQNKILEIANNAVSGSITPQAVVPGSKLLSKDSATGAWNDFTNKYFDLVRGQIKENDIVYMTEILNGAAEKGYNGLVTGQAQAEQT